MVRLGFPLGVNGDFYIGSITVRRGRDADGAQRRLCRGCGRSFRASTGRALGTTKLPAATWARYAEAMLAGATLRDAAAACGVSLKTSFSMRHRL